jgi:hypothetical protein
MYCKKCGGKLESYASNCAFCGTPVEKYDTNVNYVREEKENPEKHMTVLKWLGFNLLPAIPVVGVIIYIVLLIKWSSKKNSDLTLRSFARYNLLMFLIGIILVAVLLIILLPNLPELAEELANEMQL